MSLIHITEAFMQNVEIAPWKSNTPLAFIESVVFVCASLDYIIFTILFLVNLVSTWQHVSTSQKITSFLIILVFMALRVFYIPALLLLVPSSYIVQFEFRTILFSVTCIAAVYVMTFLIPMAIGIWGAFKFEAWPSKANTEAANGKLVHMLGSGKLSQMVIMIQVNNEEVHAVIRTIKSIVRSTYDPRYLVVHIGFNSDEQSKTYLQIVQFLSGKRQHPAQGYPLRHPIEHESVQFVLHRGKGHGQGVVYSEIQQTFKGMNHRTFLVSVDADMILYEDCLVEMVYSMENRAKAVGVTGFITGTCPSRGSAFRHFQEAEFVAEQMVDRSLEMVFGNSASVPCSLIMVNLAEFEKIAKSYLTDVKSDNFEHLGQERLILFILTQQHKSTFLKFCPNARVKTEAATSWSAVFEQEHRWHMPYLYNKAHFMVDMNLWIGLPIVQTFKLLRTSVCSMHLFFHLAILQIWTSNSSIKEATSSIWLAPIAIWIMYSTFAIAIKRVSIITMFPLTLIVNPWMRLLINSINMIRQQMTNRPIPKKQAVLKNIQVGYNVKSEAKRSIELESNIVTSTPRPESVQSKPTGTSTTSSTTSMSQKLHSCKSFDSLQEPEPAKPQHGTAIARLVRTSSMRGLKSTGLSSNASSTVTSGHSKGTSGSQTLHRSNSANFKLFGRS
ncbi:hypothetical protein BDV3_005598 [Batrachochytrium dendrobatidis]